MRKCDALLALAFVLAAAPGRAGGEPVRHTANGLLAIDSSDPGRAAPVGAITGLLPGESVVAIDFRPATGNLYGLALVPIGPAFGGRRYTIDPRTAAATPVGGVLPPGTLAPRSASTSTRSPTCSGSSATPA